MTENWILNASPLIVLARIGHEELCLKVPDSVVVPETVAAEVQAGPPKTRHALPWHLAVSESSQRLSRQMNSLHGTWALARPRFCRSPKANQGGRQFWMMLRLDAARAVSAFQSRVLWPLYFSPSGAA